MNMQMPYGFIPQSPNNFGNNMMMQPIDMKIDEIDKKIEMLQSKVNELEQQIKGNNNYYNPYSNSNMQML